MDGGHAGEVQVVWVLVGEVPMVLVLVPMVLVLVPMVLVLVPMVYR